MNALNFLNPHNSFFPEVTKYGNLTLIGRFLVLLEIVVNDFFSVLTNDG
jgi:hypothetical protein